MDIYREVISKRLKRKKEQYELIKKSMEMEATPAEKREYVDLKAEIKELETVLDIADTLSEMEDGNGKLQQKDS